MPIGGGGLAAGVRIDDLVQMTEEEVHASMASLVRREELVVEGAGAVAAAGLEQLAGHRRIARVTCRNVDAATLDQVLAEAG